MERRENARLPYSTLMNQVQSGTPGIGRTVNLSARGLCFDRLTGPMNRMDEVISVEFRLPRTREILVAQGKPVAVKGRRVHMTFQSMTRHHQEMLSRFLVDSEP